MTGETNLTKLIQGMEPRLNSGAYVFTTVDDINTIQRADNICEFKEKEGVTVVLEKEKADQLGLSYDFVASWITLTVHSSLDAVGLTATISTELAKFNISCNVIAGYYHDHIFVDQKDGQRTFEILKSLAENYGE